MVSGWFSVLIVLVGSCICILGRFGLLVFCMLLLLWFRYMVLDRLLVCLLKLLLVELVIGRLMMLIMLLGVW